MDIVKKSFQSYEEVKDHIKSGLKTFYTGSRTSTVIPYDFIEKVLGQEAKIECIGDLSTLKGHVDIDEERLIAKVSGQVTWKELKAVSQSKGLEVMTSPTEELASVLSGVATSCTGERCFGLGTMRNQILELSYINYLGEEKTLKSSNPIEFDNEQYMKSYEGYEAFKNAPFPRLKVETDLMTGTEGQLGVISSVTLKLKKSQNIRYIFVNLPRWEESFEYHYNLYNLVQNFRGKIISCELIDSNSLNYLPKEKRPCEGKDLIFLEILEESFEEIYESVFSKLGIADDQFFEVPFNKCRDLRMDVPRYIFEENSRAGVQKVGTDVQVIGKDFLILIEKYRQWAKGKIPYNLFGHFGDGHLHFNFMPNENELDECKEILTQFYSDMSQYQVSPFAEHGIGLIKRDFIKAYWNDIHFFMFKDLKDKFDPNGIFFPGGYMEITRD